MGHLHAFESLKRQEKMFLPVGVHPPPAQQCTPPPVAAVVVVLLQHRVRVNILLFLRVRSVRARVP